MQKSKSKTQQAPALISLNSPEGQRLLKEASSPGLGCYQPILCHIFSKQSVLGGCGIQTAALLLSANAIGQRGEHSIQSASSLHSASRNDNFAKYGTPHSNGVTSSRSDEVDSTRKQNRQSPSSSTAAGLSGPAATAGSSTTAAGSAAPVVTAGPSTTAAGSSATAAGSSVAATAGLSAAAAGSSTTAAGSSATAAAGLSAAAAGSSIAAAAESSTTTAGSSAAPTAELSAAAAGSSTTAAGSSSAAAAAGISVIAAGSSTADAVSCTTAAGPPLILTHSSKRQSVPDLIQGSAGADFAGGQVVEPRSQVDHQRGLPYTELTLYDHPATLRVTSREVTSRRGATLGQVSEILRQLGCSVEVVHASESDVMQFRLDAVQALSSRNSATGIMVNFARGMLWPGVMGVHHSPLAAYHKATDRLLVLDTAPAYLEFWVKVPDLYVAMNTLDGSAGRTRGYCIVSKTPGDI